jgi:MFS family permease
MAEKVSTGGRGALFPFTLLFGALYASFGVMSPFLPTLLQDRGLTAKEIGVVLALSTVARLVSGPLAGRTADLLAALRGVFATFALAAALSGLGYVPAHAFWTVLAVGVLYAAMLAPLTTIADALALAAAGSAGEASRGRAHSRNVRQLALSPIPGNLTLSMRQVWGLSPLTPWRPFGPRRKGSGPLLGCEWISLDAI